MSDTLIPLADYQQSKMQHREFIFMSYTGYVGNKIYYLILSDKQSKILCEAANIGMRRHAMFTDERLIQYVKPVTQ